MGYIHRIFLLAAAVIAVGTLILMPKWTVDDAYISYRYAHNLYEAGTLTWNVGAAPVEGYTGIMLPVLAWLCFLLGIPVVTGMKVIGVLALAGTGWLMWRLMKRLGIRKWIAGATVFFFSICPIIYMHALSGLETMLFAMLMLLALLLYLNIFKGRFRLPKVVGLAATLLLLCLTRPEGVAFSIVLLTVLFLRPRFRKRDRRQTWMVLAGLLFLPGLAYFAWRWQYYGDFLPNSFYVKSATGLVNLQSAWELFRFLAAYVAVPLGLGLLLWRIDADNSRGQSAAAGKLRYKPFMRTLRIGIVFAVICLLFYLRSNLYMNFGDRFMMPLLPVLLIVAAGMFELGIGNLAIADSTYPLKFRMLQGGLVLGLLLQLLALGQRHAREWNFLNDYHAIVQDEFLPVAELLKETLPPDARLIAYQDAGAVPFLTGFHTTDFGRLNDRYLARERPDPAAAAAYFFAQDADAVVMSSWSADRPDYIEEAQHIVQDPRFKQYKFIKAFGNRADFPYYQRVYLHTDHIRR